MTPTRDPQWRGLEQLEDSPAFRTALEAEILSPGGTEVGRRSLLQAMAASLALAGLAACQEDERALPYVEAPENIIPGRPRWYATSVRMAGWAMPVLGRTEAGRPVKLEGNPDHPASGGATDAFTQAALLGLYDPTRSRGPRHLGQPASWDAFAAAIAANAAALDARGGEGLRLLTGTVTSPTFARQWAELARRWPGARRHVWEPIGEDLRLQAVRLAFGRPLAARLDPEAAEVLVSLDDDLLGPGPYQTRNARAWSRRRQDFQQGRGDSLLFMAEPTPSATGAVSAHRLIAEPRRIGLLVQAMAAAVDGMATPDGLDAVERGWVEAVAATLQAHAGRSLVTVGAGHAPEVQALALLLNRRLGNVGRTLQLTEPIPASPPEGLHSLEELADDIAVGRVTALVLLDTNPVLTAPGGIDMAALIGRVELSVHAGLHADETAAACRWHVPLQHDLESWSDGRSADGLICLIQPLVRPFYDVRSAHQLLDMLGGRFDRTDHDIVQETWRQAWGQDFDSRWTGALSRGVVPDSAPAAVEVQAGEAPPIRPAAEERGLTVLFRPEPSLWDGRHRGNPWLEELPRPLTKVTWDEVVLVAPALAAAHGLRNGDEVRVAIGDAAVTGAAWIMPGQAPGTVVLTLGGSSYNAARLRGGDGFQHRAGATLEPTGNWREIATTQLHGAMDGFDFVRLVDRPDAAAGEKREAPSFYPAWPQEDGPAWGMSIDLDLCIGCNACVAACTAENNIAMVGREQVAMGREMFWLRIDRYWQGDPAAPRIHFQPVPCMHCEQAPCEMGCPVNATVHSPDGLNQQVYNRCIGTRTCSSYCPYKVRHFNWYDFTADDPPELRAARNPDVTVRSRGVMEKCTYCVQRISAARIAAKIENRPVRDGDTVTACQQACPAQAIVFGDIRDPGSGVSRRKASPRDYALLEEVNTRPRTTYLARIAAARPGSGETG
ncbi:Fe-S cluster-containing hydrogenase [Inquilinus limosus]|nr:Fe-S cluster-containing hydrogenase [Inquilinus limosus]